MRSRIHRLHTRACGLVLGSVLATLFLGASPAYAAEKILGLDNPWESVSGPVGLTAVTLGMVGMAAGVLRRKKEAQPQNQRKS